MTDRNDTRLEEDLRAALRARDPGPAPLALRERIADVPDAPTRPALRQRLARAGGPTLGIAAGLALFAVLVSLLAPGRLGPGPAAPSLVPATPSPTAQAFPVEPSGLGGVDLSTDLPLYLAAGIGLVALGAIAWLPRREGIGSFKMGRQALRFGWQWPVGLAVLAALVALSHIGTTQPLRVHVIEYGGPYAFEVDEGSDPSDPTISARETLGWHPGKTAVVGYLIENRGLLPVSLDGPLPWEVPYLLEPEGFLSPTVDTAQGGLKGAPGPITLQAGDSVYVRVLYRFPSCTAIGVPELPAATPWPTANPDGRRQDLGYGGMTWRTLPLQAHILGVGRVFDLETGFDLSVATSERCPSG